MKTIKITKMQGCGNDFVILDYLEYEKTGLSMSDLAKKLCDRHFGIGADGMIIPDTKTNGETDIAWYFYNSDGTTAQMCGNGMRCFAKYVYDNKLVDKKTFSVKTLAGIIKPEILTDGKIKVNMGTPILEDEKIPFKGERIVHVKDREFQITPVSMGNPHAIVYLDNDIDIKKFEIENIGPYFENHEAFPERINTEFIQIVDRKNLNMRVWERGSGETWACGTGACASLVATVLNGLCDDDAVLHLMGGDLHIRWDRTADTVYMEGSAVTVCSGEFYE